MANTQSRQAFLKSDKAAILRRELEQMVASPLYNTKVISILEDPSNSLFIQKHMNYMSGFPKMDHVQYVSNLKLMTKVR